MTVGIEISEGAADQAIDIFCDSFATYPVMRFVVGEDEYPERLRTLITLFVMGRVHRQHPVSVAHVDGQPMAAMTLTPPADSIYAAPGAPTDLAPLDALAEQTWEALGESSAARYRRYVEAATAVEPDEPNWHVNMIGVVGAAQGRGLARVLLDEVHARSAADPRSSGVSLTTERPRNVGFYRHFGYQIVKETSVAEGLRTWGFFRPDAS